ncbi:MAG: hypothetical protein IJ294_03415, partial [Clostridia bacterium]|nr:hypothetical protein [Clostridia bacterium]
MKRRIISFLAVVAMLVSMLTCIVVPSSAEMTDEETALAAWYKEAWKTVLTSLNLKTAEIQAADGPVKNTYAAYQAAIESTTDWADAQEKWKTVKETAASEIPAAINDEKVSWRTFTWNGASAKFNYPKYEYH